MSLSNFKRAVEIGRLSEADREWFPRWFASYADFVSRMVPVAVGTEVIQIGSPRVPTDDNTNLPINQSLVIGFLRTLRDKGVEHWRRLQAARAIAYYHTIVVRDEAMDFKPIIEKLQELAGRQQRLYRSNGRRPPSQRRRESRSNFQARTSRHSENAYAHALDAPSQEHRRYIYRLGLSLHSTPGRRTIGALREKEIGEFLTDLAVTNGVAGGTQNGAQCAILYLYQNVFQRELAFINAIRAKVGQYRPVVLTQSEVARQYPFFFGEYALMYKLMYGAGLRHRECRTLRVKDVCIETRTITVRNGKGMKDRVTVMPQNAIEMFQAQLARVSTLHKSDLAQGFGEVYLPFALANKYPNADREFCCNTCFLLLNLAETQEAGRAGDIICTSELLENISKGHYGKLRSISQPLRTPCDTVSLPICSKVAPIFEPFKSC